MDVLVREDEVNEVACVLGGVQDEQEAIPANDVAPVFVGSSQSFNRLAEVVPF